MLARERAPELAAYTDRPPLRFANSNDGVAWERVSIVMDSRTAGAG